MTDIEITAAHIQAALRCIAKSSFDTAVPAADMQSATGSSRNRPLLKLSPSFRRVHAEANGVEREPIGDEPFTIVERRGNFEYCVLPVFRRPYHGIIHLVKPRLNGPWDICEGSDEELDDRLDDGVRQGWFVWIRLAKGARS
ncbi:hypothetical protein ACVIHC_005426 [Bradyrhizobium diazoefficiens]